MNYKLRTDEVVLFKEEILLNNQTEAKILLTNLNIVFVNNNDEINVYPVEDIKVYQNLPQLKAKGKDIEIYFLNEIIEFSCKSKLQTNKFIEEVRKLVTGKSKFQRKTEKFKENIDIVNNTLGIDCVSLAENLIVNGITHTSGISKGIKKISSKITKK